MINQQELLKAWQSLREKLITTLTQLKQRVSPEVLNLEKQILAKIKEIETKQNQLNNLPPKPEEVKTTGGSPKKDPYKQQKDELESQMRKLEGEERSLLDKLKTIQPFLVSVKEFSTNQLQIKETENKKLNYLYSLETSLKDRELENSQYEQRIERAETKWSNAEKKLEKVRDLTASGQLMKLIELVKRGEI